MIKRNFLSCLLPSVTCNLVATDVTIENLTFNFRAAWDLHVLLNIFSSVLLSRMILPSTAKQSLNHDRNFLSFRSSKSI